MTDQVDIRIPIKPNVIKWLGEIPRHWNLIKMRQILHPVSIKNHPELPLLSVVREQGVIVRDVTDKKVNHNFIPDDLSKYKMVEKGQFVINKMKAWQGSYGISKHAGIVSPAYFVFDISFPNLAFFNYAIRSKIYVNFFGQASGGIRVGQWDLQMDRMKEIPFVVPPADEQRQIVYFLDWKISEINKLISIKKKQVSLYKELRKALVDEGILYGFRKGKSKESGIYWLGNIPESWEILPLKRVCKVNASISDIVKTMDDSDLVTFIPMSSVSATGNADYSEKGKIADFRKNFSSFAKGDVVVAKITPCFENGKGACLDKLDTAIGFGTTEFINLRPTSRILSRYLYMITMTRPFRELGEKVMTGSAGQKRVPVNYIKNFTLGIPGIKEQKEILEKIDRKLKQVDELISAEIQSIKELQELKITLISDVVTGKIDVRNVEIPEYERVEENFTEDDSSVMSEEFEK